jgi:hypothetical protein
LPKCPAASFHNKAPEHITEAPWPAVEPILEQIGSLTERIRQYDRQLETISKETYPETELLRQVEGVRPLTALTFVLTLEEPLCRSLPGAGTRQGSVGRQRPPETHLQGGFGDA